MIWSQLSSFIIFLCKRDQFANEQKIFEKMNGKGRGGKYLERENIFSAEEDKRWKGEKYLVFFFAKGISMQMNKKYLKR